MIEKNSAKPYNWLLTTNSYTRHNYVSFFREIRNCTEHGRQSIRVEDWIRGTGTHSSHSSSISCKLEAQVPKHGHTSTTDFKSVVQELQQTITVYSGIQVTSINTIAYGNNVREKKIVSSGTGNLIVYLCTVQYFSTRWLPRYKHLEKFQRRSKLKYSFLDVISIYSLNKNSNSV